ncbi:V-type ATP synthase subunit I [Oceanispirochaeta crateris]|uniref:V-type ATP synthase subunit I n=2 Tax=Oceanispirochaeta crateris TaxID=2518645 RepID=A0A5C1QJF8_9SPIO|nr:V-type ATP synthase subunit I [Oceanispirochaeta crateris]
MKKASFIFLEAEKDSALEKIRKAGVVHLEQDFAGSSDTLTSLNAAFARVEKAHMVLDPKVKVKTESYSTEAAESLASEILQLLDSRKESEDKRSSIASDLVKWEPWGDFDPSEISILRSRGVDLRFYEMTKPKWSELSQTWTTFSVKETKTSVFGIVAVTGDDPFPEIEAVQLPEFGISELKQQMLTEEKSMADIEERLLALAERRELLEKRMGILDQDIQYESLRSGLGDEESLLYFTGFIPTRDSENIKSLAADNGWAVLLSEPTEEDLVPSLVENNKVVTTIKPLFDILEVLPGYREMDISLDFLISFTLFFSMIIGDAGYGSLFLIITILMRFKFKKGGPGFNLMYLLSTGAIIWGALTGNWFGSIGLGNLEPLKGLVIPQIAAFPEIFGADIDSGNTIKYMCFVIATIQLCIARFKNFIFRMPSLQAFEQLGWLSMLLGIYHIVLFLVLGISPIPPYALRMIAGGLLAVIVFGQQEKGVHFLKGVLKGLNPIGLFNLFLDSIGLLSDIISYIRLFAVGLASLAIAVSFNTMAAPLMQEPGVAMIGGALILLLGHSLNIVMGALSLIVHGVRLNMLEYSGHLDMEWSGIKYKPFQKALRP